MSDKLKPTCTIGYDDELNLDIEWHGASSMADLPKAGIKLYVIPPGYTLVKTELLADISSMCIGAIAMSIPLDAELIGSEIYRATGMTHPELNEAAKESS